MSRYVVPHLFVLQSSQLEEAFAAGRATAAADLLPPMPEGREGMPIALRWQTDPVLGFARQPFTLFRRPRLEATQHSTLHSGPLHTTSQRILEWGGIEMFEITFTAAPAAGFSLIVEPLDVNKKVIPNQRIEFNATKEGRLRSHGMAYLRIRGNGSISNVAGIDAFNYANVPEWQPFERVGFPFLDDILPPSLYDGFPQGVVPDELPGFDAALLRLKVANALFMDPPSTGIASLPTPPWPAPDAIKYLSTLRADADAPIELIRACLESTDDFDLGNLQHAFKSNRELPGIRQMDIAGTNGESAAFSHFVVDAALAATSSESFAATALGYGTIDLPPNMDTDGPGRFEEPDETVYTAFDYMVAATFNLPFFGPIELAALAFPRGGPQPPDNLSAKRFQRNRAPRRDELETETVRVSWDLPRSPQGYAVGFSLQENSSILLNQPRLTGTGHDPHVIGFPESVEGTTPFDEHASFIHPVVQVPFSGTETHHYFLSGLDVFGRWSPWKAVSYAAVAPEVQQPAIHALEFKLDPPGSDPVIPAQLEIEVAWDWTDRSPEMIELGGAFVDLVADPGTEFPEQFALRADNSPDVLLRLQFSQDSDAPDIVLPFEGTVEEIERTEDENLDVRRYRVTVGGFELNFSEQDGLNYAIYARASERVRPDEVSIPIGPATASIFDPRPPAAPDELPPDLRWTALPNGVNAARGLLTWDPVPNAKGYAVWEATETAIRATLDPEAEDPPPGTPLLERAAALRDLLEQFEQESLALFARVNPELVESPNIEVELPAGADIVYVYRISAVSKTNVEGQRSSAVYFAVPRLDQPGQPALSLRSVTDDSGSSVRVTAIPSGGRMPSGYRVFRIQDPILALDVGTMGPPRLLPSDAAWEVNGGDGAASSSVSDDVLPSWYPYYYRIEAIGNDRPNEGLIAGKSLASAAQRAALPPADPPLMDNLQETIPGGIRRELRLPERINSMTIDAARSVLYAVTSRRAQVTIHDTKTGGAIESIPIFPRVFRVREVSSVLASVATGNLLYAAVQVTPAMIFPGGPRLNPIGRLVVIDLESRRLIHSVSIGQPKALAVDEQRNRIFLTHSLSSTDHQLVVLNADTLEEQASVQLKAPGNAIAIDHQTGMAYICLAGIDRIVVTDGSIPVSVIFLETGRHPLGVAIDPSSRVIAVTNQADNTVMMLHADTHAELATIPVGDGPQGIAYHQDAFYVANTGSQSISILDPSALRVLDTLSTRGVPTEVAVDVAAAEVFVLNGDRQTVTVVGGEGDSDAKNRVFSFRSDIPVFSTPIGEAMIEIYREDLDPDSGRVKRTLLRSFRADEVARGAPFTVLRDASDEELAAMPELNRSAVDPDGKVTFSLRIQSVDDAGSLITLLVRDPLERSTSSLLPERS